jgi:CHAT domain-containing protein
VKLRIGILVISVIAAVQAHGQAFDSSFRNSIRQYAQMQGPQGRGWDPMEIASSIDKFESNKLNNTEDFAGLLLNHYGYNPQAAFLLFFYNNGILRRILFEPGRVMSDDSIRISSDSLNTLCYELNNALNIHALAYQRSPKIRGARISTDDKKISIRGVDAIIKELTQILLPQTFTTQYKHLVVIPAANIGSIPFHLLKPYNDSLFLIDRCSFTVAPTLIDFVFQSLKSEIKSRGGWRESSGNSARFTVENALLVCNPAYPTHSDYSFPDLPGAESEIGAAIQRIHGKYRLLSGEDAKKQTVLTYLNGSDMAYFATHGVADAEKPMTNSFIVLAGDSGFLTSKEIQDLRLDKQYKAPSLVILSACQTGLGKSLDGGVVGSIARSFILSGSDYVIESLWNVDDMATSYLMSRFIFYITELGTNYFPAGALRLAILDTKKQFPNPAHWASFTAFGAVD